MAYDQGVAERLREAFADIPASEEKRMFGGLAMMVNGHMSCGVVGEELMVRVGKPGYEAALAQPHAREMDFTGKALSGFVYVAPEGFADDEQLAAWVQRSLDFVLSLPPK